MHPFRALAATGVLLASGLGLAQSARYTLRLPELHLLPAVSTPTTNQSATGEWKDLLQTTLTTPQHKDFVMEVSLEAGLHTEAPARGRPGPAEGPSAQGTLELRVLVDGTPVSPGPLTLTERPQHLMARLGDLLGSCSDADANGTLLATECIFTGEEQRRVLRSLEPLRVSFSLDDVGAGTHEVRIQARVSVSSQGASGSASAGAWIGRGAITLEEVRLVKSFDISG
ncbi:hypothetical protein NR798_12480 [Archangium gephyra]|uniref:hypothetical protein n=1 Tax=Archangium gephyra TaxID=48 RepID=UPI0035D4CB64